MAFKLADRMVGVTHEKMSICNRGSLVALRLVKKMDGVAQEKRYTKSQSNNRNKMERIVYLA